MNSIINHWFTEKKEILFTSDNQILGNRLKIHRVIFGYNKFGEKYITSETMLHI